MTHFIRWSSRLAVCFAAALPLVVVSCGGHENVTLPGPESPGRVLLSNGWSLSPIGTHLHVGELPMNLVLSEDGNTAYVEDNGTGKQDLQVIDLRTWTVRSIIPLHRSWLGLALARGETELLVSGGNDNSITRFALHHGSIERIDSIAVAPPLPETKVWIQGIAAARKNPIAFAVSRENHAVYRLDLSKGKVERTAELPGPGYTCLLSPDERSLFVSLWGNAQIAVLDPQTLVIRQRIAVGDHPSDLTLTPDAKRLIVACANTNAIDIIDIGTGVVTERLTSSLLPLLPAGSTPNAVAVSPDGNRLAIANADNNCVALFDISLPGHSRSLGFLPTGWYPTSVRFCDGGAKLLVLSAKGLTSFANPKGPRPFPSSMTEQYIGSMFSGILTRIDIPDDIGLKQTTSMVYANCPIVDSTRRTDTTFALWARHGLPGPIKHIFYVIKENRTYDQVLGDMTEGNGDSSLCFFPDSVTPNQHALAREFVLFDNLFCDAEVSADGHNWSMGAYATDYTEKSWPTSYGGRGGEYEFEGGYPIVYPSAGYIWDNCQRSNVSYRTYGEFAENPKFPGDSARGLMPSLVGHTAPHSIAWDLDYSDVNRIADWDVEFSRYEREGGLPQFQTIKLPNDHTYGTARGQLTPKAYVAQNDLAVGLLIERISHSKFWKESAIFIIEDDAQNGADHVDAHRTIGMMISPYTRHHAVDHTLYTTSSMLRTMELLLGMPPMSQYDACARPMQASLEITPDTSSYQHREAKINLQEKNIAGAYGQGDSERMDFTKADAVPEQELNRILWYATHPTNTPLPPIVRAGFAVSSEKDDD